MNLFKKKEPAAPEPAPSTPSKPGGKGRPTPKRRDAQARGLHPVVPTDRKAAMREAKARRDEAWRRQREAMETGDERYLPARDKGPVRRYIRDYVDARFCLGEAFMPLALGMMAVTLVISFMPRLVDPYVTTYILLGVYALILLAVIDSVLCWWTLRRKLYAKFGQDKVRAQGMVFWYIFSRAFNVRRWRQPKPQVARREYPG